MRLSMYLLQQHCWLDHLHLCHQTESRLVAHMCQQLAIMLNLLHTVSEPANYLHYAVSVQLHAMLAENYL